MTAIFLTLSPIAYLVTSSPRLPPAASPHPAARTSRIVAFDDGSRKDTLELGGVQSLRWIRTEKGGLTYRDLCTPPEGEELEVDQIVSIQYTASLIESGRVIDGTGDRPLSFALDGASEPLFQEAIQGMKIGGQRRINMPPSSKFSFVNETVQFEVEVVGVLTGLEALSFQAVRNRAAIVRTAILLSFLPDLLSFLGLLPGPGPEAATSLRAAFSANGFGAVDILNAVPSVASSAPVAVDAANQWAAQGLQGLF